MERVNSKIIDLQITGSKKHNTVKKTETKTQISLAGQNKSYIKQYQSANYKDGKMMNDPLLAVQIRVNDL